MDNLEEYTLDPTEYGGIVSFTGTITKVVDDKVCTLCTDDGITMEMLFHPAIIKAYEEQNYYLDSGDDVDILGCYINVDSKPTILILRCVVYNQSLGLIS